MAKEGIEHRFTSKNQPPNRGRKKSFLKQYIKETNISIDDVRTAFKVFLYQRSLDDIAKEMKDKRAKIPAMIYGIMCAYVKDCKRGDIKVISWLHEVVFGKADQNVNLHDDREKDITKMTQEEKQERIKQLTEEIAAHEKESKKKEREIAKDK